MKTYKLMVKQHNITGLKYLCVTTKKNHNSYRGSGIYWKFHLRKYGKSITTDLLYSSQDMEEFNRVCIETSLLFNVVDSDEWANLIRESGYDSFGNDAACYFWKSLSPDAKLKFVTARNESIRIGHANMTLEDKLVRRNKISSASILHLSKMTAEEKLTYTQSLRDGGRKWWDSLSREDYAEYTEKLSVAAKMYWDSLSEDKMSEVSIRIRNSRLNLSEEKKLLRANKIREVFATGKHKQRFLDFGVTRQGAGNPARKILICDGNVYDTIDEYCKFSGLTRQKLKPFIRKGKILILTKAEYENYKNSIKTKSIDV